MKIKWYLKWRSQVSCLGLMVLNMHKWKSFYLVIVATLSCSVYVKINS